MNELELWAGAECSVVRVEDGYVDQLALTGHASRPEDIDALAELGVRALRFPVIWERTVPAHGARPDWSFADARLERLRALGVRPIVGLVHHGSGPRWTSLLDDSFVDGLAAFARAVAERYPWVEAYTPVNEPLTTARFSALYGHWHPHARSDRAFVRALLVQCRAVRAAMRAVRAVVPAARLVQTEDLGTTYATAPLAYQARFENRRRFLSVDLLMGRVARGHPLRGWLLAAGARASELDDLVADPCPPDVVGVNHYVTSDRFLDHRVGRYPARARGGNGRHAYADVEAVRARVGAAPAHRALLERLWARYRAPLALTEVHLGCTPEEQVRWLADAWNGARRARARGVDVRAVTVWSAFGSFDWDSLLTKRRGTYEPGAFDVRGGVVRPTALARVAKELARIGRVDDPVLAQPGWWRRPERLLYAVAAPRALGSAARPIVVTGAGGTLGAAVVRECRRRALPVVGLTRGDLDVCDDDAVAGALARHRPWAVVNAAGYVRVDEAERERARCFRINARGAGVLAEACARRDVRFVTFSSDLVFGGEKRAPYVEGDRCAPLGVYGASKARAEALVQDRCPRGLVVRTSAFFGPDDGANFVRRALDALARGDTFEAMSDVVVSPTYVPDLVAASITLLVDGASGVWHLTSGGALTWAELARRAAAAAGLPGDGVVERAVLALGLAAPRPAYSALGSVRGALMRPFDDALARFVEEWSPSAALPARSGGPPRRAPQPDPALATLGAGSTERRSRAPRGAP